MFWIVDSLLMWKKQLWSDQSLVSVHYHRRSAGYKHRSSPRYKQLSSSDSEATAKQEAWPPDNNPVYVDLDSDPSGSQEPTHHPSPPR